MCDNMVRLLLDSVYIVFCTVVLAQLYTLGLCVDRSEEALLWRRIFALYDVICNGQRKHGCTDAFSRSIQH